MRIGRPTPRVVLTAEERLTLEQWARRPTTAQGLAQRAQLVLAGETLSYARPPAPGYAPCSLRPGLKLRARVRQRRRTSGARQTFASWTRGRTSLARFSTSSCRNSTNRGQVLARNVTQRI